MVTVSHHTRACPRDISGLLISAFPGSHCVVTVTPRPGFLAGDEGRGAGEGNRSCHPQKPRSRSCLYPFSPAHHADLHPSGLRQPGDGFTWTADPIWGGNTAHARPSRSTVSTQDHGEGLHLSALPTAACSATLLGHSNYRDASETARQATLSPLASGLRTPNFSDRWATTS